MSPPGCDVAGQAVDGGWAGRCAHTAAIHPDRMATICSLGAACRVADERVGGGASLGANGRRAGRCRASGWRSSSCTGSSPSSRSSTALFDAATVSQRAERLTLGTRAAPGPARPPLRVVIRAPARSTRAGAERSLFRSCALGAAPVRAARTCDTSWPVVTVAGANGSGYPSSMTDAARKLLDDVMALPARDRARVAAALIASLDEGEDESAEAAWAAEIERRAERVLAGESEGHPWSEVRERLLRRLRRE